jgi:hypothetical protein
MAHIVTENGETFLRDDWGVEDVRNIIEYNGIEDAQGFTDEDCINVLRIVARSHNASVGINWEVIEYAIEYYLQQGI